MEPTLQIARDILGPLLITGEEIREHFPRKIGYPARDLSRLERTLPPVKKLKEYLDGGHWLIAKPVVAMGLLGIVDIAPDDFEVERADLWYAKPQYRFSRQDAVGLKMGWLPISETPVPDSDGKKLREQLQLVPAGQCLPNVAEVVWAAVLVQHLRERKLFEGFFVWTSSIAERKNVTVGRYGADSPIIVDVARGDEPVCLVTRPA